MKNTLVYIALTLSTIFWGISFVMTKELFITEPNITVTILITLRLLVATCIMVPSLLLMGRMEPIRKGDFKWFLCLSLAEPFVYNLFETTGVQMVSGSLSAIIVALIPVFVPFLMHFAYHDKLHSNHIIGVVLSLGGVGIMLLGGEERLSGSLAGILCLFGAVFTALVYTLFLVKVVDHYRPITITTYQNIFGVIFYLPLMFGTSGTQVFSLSWSPKMLLLIGMLGFLCSTLAYAFYNVGVKYIRPSRACIFNNAIPVFTMIVAIIIGQESLSWVKAAGMAVVIGGVVLAQRNPKTDTAA